ncbi:hypothetical protein J3R30DRAFT_1474647 [Lentinula aciculospora]|uniref:FMR1-interacting protein 1 conserved domain-containing protein n=1 Tax=Lentinula aciculospora TaxID=153920 RepID=A0A9W9AQR6_9AGAR|nr:hypothetical protein J3R30DRAFT_1474647 [Lentinula aciculospora]
MPFLPPRPGPPQNDSIPPSQAADFALRSALTNPYSQPHSSHYARAYLQQYKNNNGMSFTNPQGYTMSSSYNSDAYVNNLQSQYLSQSAAGPSFSRPQNPINGGLKLQQSFSPANSTWYQTGHIRCTYRGCSFTGSAKCVEIHMMDRHLIYPQGWDKRQQKDWDADPSLKGKLIPIQGTNLILNTPDAIDAWVEERKKRWPSSTLVAEKKRKFEQAAARGELSVESLGLFSKKRRVQDSSEDNERNGRFRGGIGRGRDNNWTPRGSSDSGWRGRGRGRGGLSGPRRDNKSDQTQNSLDNKNDTDGSDSDSEPEVLSSKPPPGLEQQMDEPDTTSSVSTRTKPKVMCKKLPPQPKKPTPNPFAPRTGLLRNLLLPEIRMTVSNLSQAIRFLVDNDFLDGVELKPGEANAKLIQVVGSETNETSAS